MNEDIKRRRRLLLASAAVVVVALVALYLMGTVLLTLGMSVVIAYVLLPLVRLLERAMPWRRNRPGLSRGLAIGVVYLCALGIVAGVLAAMVPPSIEQGRKFADEFPTFFNAARMTLEDWLARYSDLIPVEVRDRIEETLSQAGGFLGDAAGKVAARTWGVISSSFSLALGLATAPVLVFYLLKDSGKVRESLYAPFPQALRPFPERHSGHGGAGSGRLHPGADNPGAGGRLSGNRGPVADGCAVCPYPGHHRRDYGTGARSWPVDWRYCRGAGNPGH